MIALKQLVPLNLQEEKAKFLTNEKYNPQFVYEESIPKTSLVEHGIPQPQYYDLATTILEAAYTNRTEEALFETEGPHLTQQQVTQKVSQFLDMHGLKERYAIVWSSSFVSRTSVTVNAIKLRLPADFRKEGLLGMLYHEIGTHALRRINYEQQPWFKKKTRYGFSDYLRTEEGLAVLHGLIPHTFKLAFIQAIRYVAAHYAQQHSFAEVWEFLKQFIDDPERRWIITFRQKRGLTDTSKSGGYTKDLVYLEGMVEVWQYLQRHNFDSAPLYYGKLASEDVSRAVELNPHYKPVLPSFFVTDREQYVKKLQLIGESNFLTQL